MLDVGTGTGILAVAGLLLGATTVTAVENDPEALDNAREHATLNGVAPKLILGDGARGLPPHAFDLVVANITAPLLRERAVEILAAAAPGGRVILSGLLAEEADAVADAYARAGSITRSTDGEWACLVVEVRS
jgi:ribosomal protein L11 methyltransferase